MSGRSLHIAWIGAGPGARESGGVPGVAADLLVGLSALGHRIDCYRPGPECPVPARVAAAENLTFLWGTARRQPSGWYARTPLGAFLGGLIARGLGSLRLRRVLARRHASEPYDVVYQFSNIEALAMPAALKRSVPLVIHPETHIAGELRSLRAEWRLSVRCQSLRSVALTALMMCLRSAIQRRTINGARLLVCISRVFRDHIVRDYGFPLERTVVVPNPVRLERFDAAGAQRGLQAPPVVLVLGRISMRKGIEDVIATAHLLGERGSDAQIKLVGGPSMWSDYSKLLADLPQDNAEFVGRVPPSEIPRLLAQADVLLQASKYEPFGLTVGEALAAGAPVIATSEVGAVEEVDSTVASVVAPGDPAALADAVSAMLKRLAAEPDELRKRAQAEATRLFAPRTVCEQISKELEQLVERERAFRRS
jgi:glycosyltransferase involved in cell wall biosynthesis